MYFVLYNWAVDMTNEFGSGRRPVTIQKYCTEHTWYNFVQVTHDNPSVGSLKPTHEGYIDLLPILVKSITNTSKSVTRLSSLQR